MRVDQISVQDPRVLARAVQVIRAGGTIVFPTETAYGLGCDATSASAVAKIFAIKNRPAEKTFPVIVGSIKMAQQYMEWTPLAEALAKKFWPGPLTLKLRARQKLPTIAGDGSATIRVPALSFIRELSLKTGVPIVATSANMSGGKTRYSIRGVLKEFAKSTVPPDVIIDAGRLPRRKPSTIVDARTGHPVVLRQGSIHV